jgi:hypothetical protein
MCMAVHLERPTRRRCAGRRTRSPRPQAHQHRLARALDSLAGDEQHQLVGPVEAGAEVLVLGLRLEELLNGPSGIQEKVRDSSSR